MTFASCALLSARPCRVTILVASVSLAIGLGLPSKALAQSRGSISGVVYDPAARPVGNATVRLSGPRLPGGRTTVTSPNGLYSFLRVESGEYLIEVSRPDLPTVGRQVVVFASRDVQHDFILGRQVVEAVTVSAAPAPVDTTSVEITSSLRRAFAATLPVDRSYLGLVELAPGIASNGSFAPSGGGSRQDNAFLLNGVSITNPYFGYLSTEVNELDIEEMTVTRGALSPESGRTAGLVANAVTRSGTNTFQGSLRSDATIADFRASSRDGLLNETDTWLWAGAAGGPLVTDHVFAYGSGLALRATGVRDRRWGEAPEQRDRINEGFGKLTFQIAGAHLADLSGRHRSGQARFADLAATDPVDFAVHRRAVDQVGTANWTWFAGNRTTIDVRAVYVRERNHADATVTLGARSVFDPTRLSTMGSFFDGVHRAGPRALKTDATTYRRLNARVTLSHAFETGSWAHRVKAGAWWDEGAEHVTRQSNGWGVITRLGPEDEPGWQAEYYPDDATQATSGRTLAAFLQDTVTVGRTLTFNVGVLLATDDLRDGRGHSAVSRQTFRWGQQVQPRLGITWAVGPDHTSKVFASYGRYHPLDQKSLARAVSATPLTRWVTRFGEDGTIESTAPLASTLARTLSSTLAPPRVDEFTLGYATTLGWLGPLWTGEIYALRRTHAHLIEDAPTVLPFSAFALGNDPAATRTFDTVVAEVGRPLADHWAFRASYAWSRLHGSLDQDYAGGLAGTPTASGASLIDDGPGTFTDDAGRRGPLSQDRPHVARILASWVPPLSDDLTFGVALRAQSGTPWQASGWSWASGTVPLRLLEPVGSHRLPWVTSADLTTTYRIRLDQKRTLTLEARIFNLFNQQPPIEVDPLRFLDPRVLAVDGTPPSGCRTCWTDAFAILQPQSEPNPRYSKPIAYAAPRRFVIGAVFEF